MNVEYLQWFKWISRIVFPQRFYHYNLQCSGGVEDWGSGKKHYIMKPSVICQTDILNPALCNPVASTLTAHWTNLRTFWKILMFSSIQTIWIRISDTQALAIFSKFPALFLCTARVENTSFTLCTRFIKCKTWVISSVLAATENYCESSMK